MLDFLNSIIPNVMNNTDRLFDSILATLQMTLWSGGVMFVCGLILGIILTVTREGGIMQQRFCIRCWISSSISAAPSPLLSSLPSCFR